MTVISTRLSKRLAREIYKGMSQRADAAAFQPLNLSARSMIGDVKCARDAAISARIKITVGQDWMMVAPNVQVVSPFMRFEQEWHAAEKGICYVHPCVWYEEHFLRIAHFKQKDPDEAIKWTARWLLDSVDNLVHKHFLGWQANLNAWPESWPAWLHAEDGIKQYEEEKKSAAK